MCFQCVLELQLIFIFQNRGNAALQSSGGKPKNIKVFEDPKIRKKVESSSAQKVVSKKDGGTQVEEKDVAEAKAEDFMYAEEYPPEYWKELYEKTREALETSLVENEELHTSIGLIEEEKSALIEEKDALKDMVKNADELAKILNSVMSDEEESEGSSEDEEESDDSCDEEEVESD